MSTFILLRLLLTACERSFLAGKDSPGKFAHCRPPSHIYIYIHWDSKKGLITQYQTNTKLKLICFVSFKNQNSEMYCLLLTAFYYL